MNESAECAFCRHPMSAHNTMQWDGPVCMWCGCGDEYVVEERPPPIKVWREMLIVFAIAGAILLVIQWMERMTLPW
jgi:hypothetical protein